MVTQRFDPVVLPRFIELPKYVDVILLLNDVDNRNRINRVLKRTETYIINALKYLESMGCIIIFPDPVDERCVIINLTPKGRDVKHFLSAACSVLGVRVDYGFDPNSIK